MDHDVVDVALDGVVAAAGVVARGDADLLHFAAGTVGADGPLRAVAGDRFGFGVGFGDGDQAGHRQCAVVSGVTVAFEGADVAAALFADLGVGGVRVHEDRVALLAGPVERVVGAGGDPEGRRGLLLGLGQHLDLVEVVVVAVPGDALVAPGFEHDLDAFAEAGVGLFDGHIEGAELGLVEAAPGAPIDAPAGEHVEQRDFLGDAQRVIERGEGDGGADADVLGAVGDVHAHQMHGGADAVGVEVVLGEPDAVVAGLVHDVDALEGALVDGGQGHAPAGPGEELEDAVLERRSAVEVSHARSLAAATWTRRAGARRCR